MTSPVRMEMVRCWEGPGRRVCAVGPCAGGWQQQQQQVVLQQGLGWQHMVACTSGSNGTIS
jgi:hypothetical protein